MATISKDAASTNIVPLPTVALVPGKPETQMRLSAMLKKEKKEQQEQAKKPDAHQKQPQSSTVVNISAKARELNRSEPVDKTSPAAKAGNATDQAANIPAKDKEVNRAATESQPAQPPQPPSAANTGSTAAPVAPAKKA